MIRERRYTPGKVELRTAADGTRHIVGHAAVFNRYSTNLGGFVEQVAPGAFTKTIAESDVRGLFNHDANLILGRNVAETMTLEEDNIGLGYDILAPKTSYALDLLESLDRGDVNQSSFCFGTIADEWDLSDQGFPLRILIQVGPLYDVGPVTFPAYEDADSAARAAVRNLASSRDVTVEDVLRLAGTGELPSLIKGERIAPTDVPPVIPAPADSHARAMNARRLELSKRRHPAS